MPAEVGVACKLAVVHVFVGHAEVVVEHAEDLLNDRKELIWLVVRVWHVWVVSSDMLAVIVANFWLACPIALLGPLNHAEWNKRSFSWKGSFHMRLYMPWEVVMCSFVATLPTRLDFLKQ